MQLEDKVRVYKDRIRIFLILYYFSDDYQDTKQPNLKKLFDGGEMKIQAVDFLLRNPDYFSYELLTLVEEKRCTAEEIKSIIKDIFESNEPAIRRLEMEKFFFGAYEDIDNTIAFLKAYGFIDFECKKNTQLNKIQKKYYITKLACENMCSNIKSFSTLNWYENRCAIIKKYLGHLSGSNLKARQYRIDEYKNTSYRDYIKSIPGKVKEKYRIIYGEEL